MKQRLIAVRKDGGTFVMKGDAEERSDANEKRAILPKLLADGWRIVSLHMTASAAVNDDQVLGLVVIEKL
jgi:hypothetical protein